MLTVRRLPRSRVAIPALLSTLESVTALALAHAAAGGEVPSAAWLAAFGVLVYGASVAVLRHRASIRTVGPLLLVAQVLGHAWLVALSPGHHDAHLAATGAAGVTGAMTGGLLGLSPAMLVAHVLAVVVAGGMWALRRRSVAIVVAWSDPVLARVPDRPRPTSRSTDGPVRRARALATAPTRGPPADRFATA
ncbi:hypothetical protein ACFQ0K_11920 [Nocardioides caeni]|uniref:hypothetical protein n=1 Tax=Nocardioides caeni TaxID=574700 RepID=UPI001305441E|nr:hypothetical protein [Nocardioides caeni]